MAKIWFVELGDLRPEGSPLGGQAGVPSCSNPGNIQGGLPLFLRKGIFPGRGGSVWFRHSRIKDIR